MRHAGRVVREVLMVLAVAGCAPGARAAPVPTPAAGHTSGEEAAVLAAADAFLRAITAGDRAAMGAMQMRDGMAFTAAAGDGGIWSVRGRPLATFSDTTRPADPPMRERYWAPTVLVRHAIAVVWAPYEFWVNGATSHCGVDAFGFAKVNGEWKLAVAMWTVEREACGELRAANEAGVRPRE